MFFIGIEECKMQILHSTGWHRHLSAIYFAIATRGFGQVSVCASTGGLTGCKLNLLLVLHTPTIVQTITIQWLSQLWTTVGATREGL